MGQKRMREIDNTKAAKNVSTNSMSMRMDGWA